MHNYSLIGEMSVYKSDARTINNLAKLNSLYALLGRYEKVLDSYSQVTSLILYSFSLYNFGMML